MVVPQDHREDDHKDLVLEAPDLPAPKPARLRGRCPMHGF
jgi:hypothetical protein